MFAWSLVSFCVVASLLSETWAVTITVRNNCQWPLWPAVKTGAGPEVSDTGFTLGAGQSRGVQVPSSWTAGRIWARTQCESGRCVTGDCGSGGGPCSGRTGVPPATLAEFTLNNAANNYQDTYDLSNIDGFNIPMAIEPQGGSGHMCIRTSCSTNINTVCPDELAVRNSEGHLVGCKSGCEAFRRPELCCTGDHYGVRGNCGPTSYSSIFKNQCPEAYSYAHDDNTSTYTCAGQPNYLVTFCP